MFVKYIHIHIHNKKKNFASSKLVLPVRLSMCNLLRQSNVNGPIHMLGMYL